MSKKSLFPLFILLISCQFSFGQGIVYLTDDPNVNGEPWGVTSCKDAMDSVFGQGGYTTSFYESVDPNTLFAPNNCFIYIEGGMNNDIPMNTFVTANQVLMQNWVSAGGHLFLNSAGWNTDITCGFGGVTIVLDNSNNLSSNGSVIPGQNGHPIFNNATFPSGTVWTGGYFYHDTINGPAGTPLITGDFGKTLTELAYGGGKVLFGGMTSSSFHSPQPDADNLRKAILDYLKICAPLLPPNCALLLNPTTNEQNVACNDSLIWQAQLGGNFGNPTGYKLYFGTDNPPTNIENGTIINNTFYVPIGLIPNTKYFWSVIATNPYGDAIGCGLDSFTTAPIPAAPVPIIGTTSVCPGDWQNYSVTPVNGATTYTWTVPVGATINSGQGTNSISVTFGVNGGNICVTASNTCGVSPQTCIAITLSPGPNPSNAGLDIDVCGLTTTLNGSMANVGVGTWVQITGPGTLTFVNANQNNTSVTASSYGIYNVRWTITNGNCTTSDTLKITFWQPPTPANAGPDMALCALNMNLNANLANPGTGTWTKIMGPGTATFANSNSPSSGVNVSNFGTFKFVWRIVNGACQTSDTVQITFDQMPVLSNAGPSQVLCGLTTTLSGNVPNIGSASWSMLNGPGTLNFSNVNSPSSTVTASAYGSYIINWTITNGSCTTIDSLIIQFDEQPTVALAGDDAQVCGDLIQLNGNNPSVGNGVWTSISGGGTIVNPNSNTTFVTNLNPGQNTFAWTISNGVCPPSTDQVTITALVAPIIADFSSSPTISTADDSIHFKNLSTNSISWNWDFGDNTSSTLENPTHLYDDAGTFNVILIATNSEGCTDSILKVITIEEGMYIPNIFTPNNDLSNDVFKIKSTGIKDYDFSIYNRWGTKIFTTFDSKIYWDGKDSSGKDVSSGTYYYTLKATSFSGKNYNKTGFLTLLK